MCGMFLVNYNLNKVPSLQTCIFINIFSYFCLLSKFFIYRINNKSKIFSIETANLVMPSDLFC